MKAKLSLKTIGIRRNDNPQFRDNVGNVIAFIDGNNHISVDTFEDGGKFYLRRNKCVIEIRIKGNDLFTGSIEEMEEILSTHKQNK